MTDPRYKTIAQCECTNLNKEKLVLLNDFMSWLKAESDKAFNRFRKGQTYKKIYNDLNKSIKSTYRSKICNVALGMYKAWQKRKKKFDIGKILDDNKRNLGGSMINWIDKNKIRKIEFIRDYRQFFQLKIVFMLPFEMHGKKEITLFAKVPKDFWKHRAQLYKNGFHLVVKKDYAGIHLIQRFDEYHVSKPMIKAIYASPYGGLYTTKMTNILETKRQVESYKPREFWSLACGSMQESKAFLKILNRLHTLESKENFKEDIETLKVKCRTKVNKYFKSSNFDISELVFVKTIDNKSLATRVIQETMIEQIEKHCFERGIQFEVIEMTNEELNTAATWCMTKQQRQEIMDNHKLASNRFRVLAGLKQYFRKSDLKVRLGLLEIRKKKKSSGTFPVITSSTPEMSQVDYSKMTIKEVQKKSEFV